MHITKPIQVCRLSVGNQLKIIAKTAKVNIAKNNKSKRRSQNRILKINLSVIISTQKNAIMNAKPAICKITINVLPEANKAGISCMSAVKWITSKLVMDMARTDRVKVVVKV
ncbi:MAG: hypothetical protein FWC12_12735 [Treponema sp.]|nr:hypothetical protein [Treponema sp.]